MEHFSYHPPAPPSLSLPFSLSLSLNSILIRFNLLFNSRTLSGVSFSLIVSSVSPPSLLHCPPPSSIHPFQVFILFSISSFFQSLSLSLTYISKREREGEKRKQGKEMGKGEKVKRYWEKLKSVMKWVTEGDERTKEDEGRKGEKGKRAGEV